jgi:hypothetical protein
MIEAAKSGRARCRKCKQPIEKGELRFGEESAQGFGSGDEKSFFWYHLACAAKQRPQLLKTALETFTGEVPNRAELEATMQASAGKQKPSSFPYAERAPSGRSRCLACELTIEKGALRVAIEREVDTGSFVTKGAGYLHPACALEFVDEPEGFPGKVTANSSALPPADLAELKEQLGS